MPVWSRRKPDEVTKVGWRTITRKHFLLPDGTAHDFDTIATVGAQVAAVVALTEDGLVIIAEQFRAGPELMMQDIPGGMVDAGEEPIEAARRELLEETGYRANTIELLGIAHDDGYSNTARHFFIARGCKKVAEQALEEAEDIAVKLISVEELLDNARSAKMTDALAVFYAYDELKKLI